GCWRGYIFTSGEKWKLPEETTVNKKVKKIITELTITPLITDYGARHTYGSVKVQEGVVWNLLLLRNLNYLFLL
ncbi:hypothetical protein MK547_10345, partial [Streptococcus agalactiae]|nr:hypothetical protein [Streptococcus agalactiae]